MRQLKFSRDNLLRVLVLLFSLLHVFYYFFPWPPVFYLSLICLFYILAVSLFNMPRLNRRIVGGLFILAAALMIYARADWRQWAEGLSKNGLLVALFACAPLLHLPFTYEDYQSELKNIAQLYMRTMLPFNFLIAIPTHIFGALTGFAAFAIMYNLFLETSRLYRAEDVFIASLGRSYSTSGFWGTSWVSVMLIVSEFGIPWYRIILVGLVFTAVSIAVNLLSIKIKMLRQPGRYPTLTPDTNVAVHWGRVGMMLFLSVCIVLIALAINQTLGWNLLAVVPLISLFFPFVVALAQNKRPELKQGLSRYFDQSLFKCRTELSLFTAAGLLAHALDISGAGAVIPRLIPTFLTNYPVLLIIALMLLIILPGQLGVHPMATGTTLVAVINPAVIGLTIPVFAMTIICAWLLSNMLSPFSALNLTLSGLSGKSTWHTGLKLNWRYGVVCLLLYSVLVLVLGPLLG